MSGASCGVAGYMIVVNELAEIKLGSKVSRKDMAELYRRFGSRFAEAWRLVKEKSVKKYVFKPSGLVRWVVVGEGKEYLVYGDVGYCSCDDFFFAVMNNEAKACKHLIAHRIASALGLFDVFEEPDEMLPKLLEEWR